MKLDYIGKLIQAMYKSGKLRIEYVEMPEILDNYYGKDNVKHPSVSEFIAACQEFVDGSTEHLVIGGRGSKNPLLLLHGNHPNAKRFYR